MKLSLSLPPKLTVFIVILLIWLDSYKLILYDKEPDERVEENYEGNVKEVGGLISQQAFYISLVQCL